MFLNYLKYILVFLLCNYLLFLFSCSYELTYTKILMYLQQSNIARYIGPAHLLVQKLTSQHALGERQRNTMHGEITGLLKRQTYSPLDWHLWLNIDFPHYLSWMSFHYKKKRNWRNHRESLKTSHIKKNSTEILPYDLLIVRWHHFLMTVYWNPTCHPKHTQAQTNTTEKQWHTNISHVSTQT